MVARLAFELATDVALVGVAAAAPRAYGIAVRFGPADFAEQAVSLVLSTLIDVLERESVRADASSLMFVVMSSPAMSMYRI